MKKNTQVFLDKFNSKSGKGNVDKKSSTAGSDSESVHSEKNGEIEFTPEVVLLRRITAICQRDKYVYRDAIINNIGVIRIILNDGTVYDADKAAAVFGELRDRYYKQVADDFIKAIEKNMDPGVYERVAMAMKNPALCGLEGRDPGRVWMAGDLYALSYWAITFNVADEAEYKKITDIQNEIMEEALQEALDIMESDQ